MAGSLAHKVNASRAHRADYALAGKMRFLLGAAVLFFTSQVSFAQTPACEQAAFAAAVSEAGATLSAMNEENKKAFQGKLLALKAREGWTDADYPAKATPFVKDETIAALDEGNKALLAKVPQLGGATDFALAGAAGLPDKRCAMLGELRGLMAKVVENTRSKWAHMLAKLDTALEAPRQVNAAGQ
jgi:hypothetical protein